MKNSFLPWQVSALDFALSGVNTNSCKTVGQITTTLFASLVLAATSADVRAATITVTNTAYVGAGTLGTAIASAQNGDTINFALPTPSTITPNGSFQVNKSLAILGPGPTNLFIKGNGSVQAAGLFNLIGPSNNITIAGLTITNGNTVYGAGIYNDRCNVIVSNVVLTGNSAQNAGGAIFSGGGNSPYNATLTVVDTIISGNTTGGEGGGIYNSGADGGNTTVSLTNCTLSGNSAQIGSGGAILNDQGTLIISNSIIAANLANTSGGGIANSAQIGKSASLLIAQSLLSGNVSTNNLSLGGGVYNAGTSVQIIGCTLSGNSAGGGGAGLASQYASGRTGSVQIVNSTLSGNLALQGNGNGGAIYLSANPGGTATVSVVNTTLSGNQADYSGGGIYMANSSGASLNLDVLSCTSSGNSSLAIFSDGGHVNIGNSILNDDAISLGGTGPFTSLRYNLCSDNGGGFLTNATDQINTDPLLGPLQDNGGPSFTHAPLPGSPAVDKGRNLSASATDQRGFPRTLDIAGLPNSAGADGTDIGAVESRDASLRLVNPTVVSNQFGFNLVGPFTNVVVEASTNVAGTNWTALATNTLGDAALRFNDLTAPNLPERFYRARVQ